MRRKSVALVMAAATALSLMAGSGVSALADEETVELTMWGGWAGDQIGQLEKQLEGFNNSQDKIHVTYMAQDSMEQKRKKQNDIKTLLNGSSEGKRKLTEI